MEIILSYVIAILCVCFAVFGHQVRLSTYTKVPTLSSVIYKNHILEKSNVSSALSCGLLCRGNPQCLSMSYNFDEKDCKIFGIVYCNSIQGIPRSGTNYYIVKDSQVRSIYLKCKDTKQSSTYPGGSSSWATDGIWEARLRVKPCSHTGYESRPWWYVDLEEDYIIHKIKILNRKFSPMRLRKLILTVGEDLQSMTQCGYHADYVPSAQNVTITCAPPTKGRFVRILMDATDVLTLCEVGVYGQMLLN